MMDLNTVRGALRCLAYGNDATGASCADCAYRDTCKPAVIAHSALQWLELATEAKLLGAMVIPKSKYQDIDTDIWAENLETGEVTAVDRAVVPAFLRYMKLDAGTPRRLWTARPTEEERRNCKC